MTWTDNSLVIRVNERCVPLPFALRGTVTLKPKWLYDHPVVLDAKGHHTWRVVAPLAEVEVDMQAPVLSWRGIGYHDMNWGSEPLEAGFQDWTWARSTTTESTDVIYDITCRDNSRNTFGLRFEHGGVAARPVPAEQRLPKGFWGMARPVRSDASPRLIATLEDAPFYTRNHLGLIWHGLHREAVHESLSLDRFSHPIVQRMLPFRMLRRG
jgi:carotenoid 1,2-hydratase